MTRRFSWIRKVLPMGFGAILACCSIQVMADEVSGAAAQTPSTAPELPNAAAIPPDAGPAPRQGTSILILEGSLPEGVKYEFIAHIKVRQGGYRNAEQVLSRLADRARKIGADAVVQVKTWRQPAGFSWASPHADGDAVKILNKEEAGDLSRFGPML
jgi:hypothetical protein